MMNPIPVFLHTTTPLYAHPHAVFAFLHLALCSQNSSYSIHHLFRLNSSLHKQPFITAHFVHHCTLKQALLDTPTFFATNHTLSPTLPSSWLSLQDNSKGHFPPTPVDH